MTTIFYTAYGIPSHLKRRVDQIAPRSGQYLVHGFLVASSRLHYHCHFPYYQPRHPLGRAADLAIGWVGFPRCFGASITNPVRAGKWWPTRGQSGTRPESWRFSHTALAALSSSITITCFLLSAEQTKITHHGRARRDSREFVSSLIPSWYIPTKSCSFYSRGDGGGGGDSGNEAGRDSESEVVRNSGSGAERDSVSRKRAKRRRYAESHQNRSAHPAIDPQVKEASEHWWIGGLCPELAIEVWFPCPMVPLHSI